MIQDETVKETVHSVKVADDITGTEKGYILSQSFFKSEVRHSDYLSLSVENDKLNLNVYMNNVQKETLKVNGRQPELHDQGTSNRHTIMLNKGEPTVIEFKGSDGSENKLTITLQEQKQLTVEGGGTTVDVNGKRVYDSQPPKASSENTRSEVEKKASAGLSLSETRSSSREKSTMEIVGTITFEQMSALTPKLFISVRQKFPGAEIEIGGGEQRSATHVEEGPFRKRNFTEEQQETSSLVRIISNNPRELLVYLNREFPNVEWEIKQQ